MCSYVAPQTVLLLYFAAVYQKREIVHSYSAVLMLSVHIFSVGLRKFQTQKRRRRFCRPPFLSSMLQKYSFDINIFSQCKTTHTVTFLHGGYVKIVSYFTVCCNAAPAYYSQAIVGLQPASMVMYIHEDGFIHVKGHMSTSLIWLLKDYVNSSLSSHWKSRG